MIYAAFFPPFDPHTQMDFPAQGGIRPNWRQIRLVSYSNPIYIVSASIELEYIGS
jgi:hypothetical protein